MRSPRDAPPPTDAPPAKKSRCGSCGGFNHDRRNCPVSRIANPPVNQPDVAAAPPLPPLTVTAVRDPTFINWEHVMYVVFDLETTGGSRRKNEIIELAAVALDKNGIQIEDAVYYNFIKPNAPSHNLSLISPR